jgi:peptidyl-tRNA hydrolase, PTH1 family
MKIIAGLGNPGEKYKNTRHNVGFMAIDFLVKEKNLAWQFNKKFNLEIAKDIDAFYVKPMSYMNNSGIPIKAIMSYYKLIPAQNIISSFFKSKKNTDLSNILTVIHDDLDIESGKIKESLDSRSGGHKGVQSIIDNLKTKNFKRLRIGIKTEKQLKIPVEKYVLQKFNEQEEKDIEKIIKNIKV